jgi:integrase
MCGRLARCKPHGMAIKYHLPGGVDTDMVTNSLEFFPAGTGEDFRDLLLAIIVSPPDAPKPTKLEQFFVTRLKSLSGVLSGHATAYSLRHARISELLQIYGVDPLTVAAQTGTSVAMIEKAYLRFIPSAMLEKLAAAKG